MKYINIHINEDTGFWPGRPYKATYDPEYCECEEHFFTPKQATPIIHEIISHHQSEIVRLEHMLFELEAENDATI